jgi:hypothetical protein
MPIATLAALIELAVKMLPLVMQAIQVVEKAQAEKRALTPEEHRTVAAAVAAGAAHAAVMGIPASAAQAPAGPAFETIS